MSIPAGGSRLNLYKYRLGAITYPGWAESTLVPSLHHIESLATDWDTLSEIQEATSLRSPAIMGIVDTSTADLTAVGAVTGTKQSLKRLLDPEMSYTRRVVDGSRRS